MRPTRHDPHDAPDAPLASATAIAAAVRAGTTSAVEVLDRHVGRIERANARINAIVRFDLDRARARAVELDRARARGEPLGPLHGVPFTLEDMHATESLGASAGTRATQRVPARHGAIAARLERVGAVLLGKTNMSNSVQTMSEQFGRTSNPYDVRRTSGGSSGGAAAAVAAGLSAFDVGTDLSGSIRMPAHFCGVFGLRPTPHRIPVGDLIMGPAEMPRVDRALGVAGPIARTAQDIGLLLGVLAGPDPSDPEVPPVPVAPIPRVDLRGLRVAVAPKIRGVHIAADISSAVERLAARLADAGAHVEPREPVAFDALLAGFRELLRTPMSLAFAVGLAPPGSRPADYRDPTPLETMTALAERDRFIAAADAFFASFDAFVCPAATTTAFLHCDRGAPVEIDGTFEPSTCIDHPTIWSTYTGCPSLVVPVALDPRGMPIGVQLVGRRWCDEQLIGLGAAVADVAGRLPPPSVPA
ncbi:MAG: amidase [Deltaproteobacteria bacterium]|nr:amidase [Deltaproteobacteria bacterium]